MTIAALPLGSPRREPAWSRLGPTPSSPPLDASLSTWFKLEEQGPREEAASRKGEFARLQGNYTDSSVFLYFYRGDALSQWT